MAVFYIVLMILLLCSWIGLSVKFGFWVADLVEKKVRWLSPFLVYMFVALTVAFGIPFGIALEIFN